VSVAEAEAPDANVNVAGANEAARPVGRVADKARMLLGQLSSWFVTNTENA
jgi:hypothetical protein